MVELCRVHDIDIKHHGVVGMAEDPEELGGPGFEAWGTSDEGTDRDGDLGPGYQGNLPNRWIWIAHAYCSYGNRVYDLATGNTYGGTWDGYFKSLMATYVHLAAPDGAYEGFIETTPGTGTVKVYHYETTAGSTDDETVQIY